MKRGLALVVLIAGAAATTALLTNGHAPSAQAAVRRAARRTLDAGSSRFTIKQSFTGVVSAPAPDVEEQGIMDYRRHRGSVRDSLFGFEEIYDGDTVYFNWPSLMTWLPKDKPWIRSTESDDPFDPEAKALRDPTRLLHFLRSTSIDVRRVGTEAIGGAQTTHYEGTLDLQKIVDQAPADERPLLQDDLDFMKQDTATTISYGLWVDASDITRRLRIDGGDGRSFETIDFFDYGVTVDVQPPPQSQVLSDDEFAALMMQHANDSGCDGQGQSTGSGEMKTVLCLGTIPVSPKRSK